MTSIIERDLQFYQEEVERLRDHLAKCAPNEEDDLRSLLGSALRLVEALAEYAEALDSTGGEDA